MFELTQVIAEMTPGAESARHRGGADLAAESGDDRFAPAFLDSATGKVHLSRYADGRPAPFHTPDGLPSALVLMRNVRGGVARVKPSVVSGFVRDGRFYTRAEAAARLRAAAWGGERART